MLEPTPSLPRRFFVGPHALKRWRERIDPTLSDQQIRYEIERRLQPPALPAAVNIYRSKNEDIPDYPCLIYRCRYEDQVYIAIVSHSSTKDPAPVVVTILPDDEQLSRIEKYVIGKWRDKRHMVYLRFLRTFGWFSPEDCATILKQPIEGIRKRWEEAGAAGDRHCGTCQLFGRATQECMHYDCPVSATRSAWDCEHYIEDIWEVVKSAKYIEIPDEVLAQAVEMQESGGLSLAEIAKRLGYSEATLWRRMKEWDKKKGRGGVQKVKPETEKAVNEPAPITVPAAEPVCSTCIHRPVCRYQDTYRQHQEWAVCKWWRKEEAA